MSAKTFIRPRIEGSAIFAITIMCALVICCRFASADELLQAAMDGDLLRVQEQVKANPNLVSRKDIGGATPLYCAIEYRHPDMAEWLILDGADVEAADTMGKTPLHWAAALGYKDVVGLLLAHGAKVDARTDDNMTPLIWTTNKEVAELLVEHGADVNAKDGDGRTPLLAAEGSQNNDWVEFMLAHGAKVEFLSSPGLWLKIHCLWLTGIAATAATIWFCYFWPRRKTPAPSRKIRFTCWLGIYLAGSWALYIDGVFRFGFAFNPLVFVVGPLGMPGFMRSLLPDSWGYALFEHLHSAVATLLITLVPYGAYLLNLIFSMYVKRFQTFCALLVLLIFLIFLSAIGLAEGIANFPHPD